MLKLLKKRSVESHKGDYGHVVLIGGSRRMPGAISLSALAALRSGAGLVTVATSRDCQGIVASYSPCFMTLELESDGDGQIGSAAAPAIHRLLNRATCVGLGPGLGRNESLDSLVGDLFDRVTCPMVVDADALNALSRQWPRTVPAAGSRILTPHPGEFERLTHVDRGDRESQCATAQKLAATVPARHPLVVLLKGHQSFLADGQQTCVNPTGTPAMATGGAGDVLTGVICAFIAQGLAPWDAACLGAKVHGRAGELAELEVGPVGVVATDLIQRLPAAIAEMGREP